MLCPCPTHALPCFDALGSFLNNTCIFRCASWPRPQKTRAPHKCWCRTAFSTRACQRASWMWNACWALGSAWYARCNALKCARSSCIGRSSCRWSRVSKWCRPPRSRPSWIWSFSWKAGCRAEPSWPAKRVRDTWGTLWQCLSSQSFDQRAPTCARNQSGLHVRIRVARGLWSLSAQSRGSKGTRACWRATWCVACTWKKN